MADAEYAVTDREFYTPLAGPGSDGDALAPSPVPDGWRARSSGIWTMWQREGLRDVVQDGWKVHVSARRSRTRPVLDAVAGVCFAQGVAFKHISTDQFYWWVHHKQAPRPQSGKFIAAYPADAPAARRLMDQLREVLDGEDGPYILSDRRYRDSRTVHYRYGAFLSRDRVEPDGTRTPLVADGDGTFVPDLRGLSFHLPPGITDPFAEPTARPLADPQAPAGPQAPTTLHGFTVDGAIRHSNGGGTYTGRQSATGRKVFIKEARPFHGLGEGDSDAVTQLDTEWHTLTALHALAPGLAPEPIARFRAWDHEFMVTEFVDGVPLSRLMVTEHPLLKAAARPEEHTAYYTRCEAIVTGIEQALDRLHVLGYLFVDVNPGNVIVTAGDGIRLVDFEAAHGPGTTPPLMGTPGYTPPRAVIDRDGLRAFDDYGVSALTQTLLGPLHHTVRRNPDALDHLHHDIATGAPVPPALWKRVTRYHPPSDTPALPTPEQTAADPLRHLTALREAVANSLTAMADPAHPQRVFPTVPRGYRTNTLCVAYGTAGVVHALGSCGIPLPDGVLERLRRDALAAAGTLAPGLHTGLAGIAWVLADQGLLDEARDLLERADRHPLTGECATLAGGSAGVALTHLALHRRTGDAHHLDRAQALLAALPADDLLAPQLGKDDATGLLHGRCGTALAHQQLAAVTGETGYLDRALRLLHAELDRAVDPEAAGLVFPVSDKDRRAMPYLYCGAAGMVHVATRCLRAADDERLAAAMPRLLAPLHGTYTVLPSLYPGTAGFAFALAEHAHLTGDDASRTAAVRAARALFKHAVPHESGVRFLGEGMLRFSAELWSGSAGILLALDQVLRPRADRLFTLDVSAE